MGLEKLYTKVEEALIEYQKLDSRNDILEHFEKLEYNGKMYIGKELYVTLRMPTYGLAEKITIPEIMKSLKNDDVIIFVKDRVKFKKIINNLIKENFDEDEKIKLAKKLIGDPIAFLKYEEASEFVKELVKKNEGYSNVAKKILLSSFENMLDAENKILVCYSFRNILLNMSALTFEPDDYNSLHLFFTKFKKTISSDFESKNEFNNFLRYSINYKDWEQFQKYLGKEIEKVNGEIFSENNNQKFELVLNKSAILQQYPSLLVGNDYMDTINKIVFILNNEAKNLNLEKCCRIEGDLFNGDISTSLYFVSKDNKQINKDKIKTLVSGLLDLCSEFIIRKEDVNLELLQKYVESGSLSFDLPQNQGSPKKLKI